MIKQRNKSNSHFEKENRERDITPEAIHSHSKLKVLNPQKILAAKPV